MKEGCWEIKGTPAKYEKNFTEDEYREYRIPRRTNFNTIVDGRRNLLHCNILCDICGDVFLDLIYVKIIDKLYKAGLLDSKEYVCCACFEDMKVLKCAEWED